ncbi:transcriptional factor b3 [Moniliophthora roreri MCA 2997]|uniref:Transcriptional factor b3 n=2 Tax=Moniliophthora roreri TaxID=221103 RepID=V2XU32_MONRO|nr:transcriptional factor b3 [Moniliophthora roreri MCA 2997]
MHHNDNVCSDTMSLLQNMLQHSSPYPHISDSHPAYAPLQYVLLFPHGEAGWHYGLLQRATEGHQGQRIEDDEVGEGEDEAEELQQSSQSTGEFSTILNGGRLLQQYVVDMWASADQNRLHYLCSNQNKLHASVYSGLEDSMNCSDDNILLNQLGQRYILPSSYIGGPQNMQQCYQDAMALAQYYRNVNIFLTMTANPEWKEVTDELYPWQSPYDRPDLISRVFHLKKQALIDDITKKHIFGPAVAFVYTIEFQKHGLPHMHLLIFLQHDHKLLTPAAIDSTICAEWPDPITQPKLFQTVCNCMIHGPCGTLNQHAPCMEDHQCKKFFPKPFQAETTLSEDGYPLYQCHDDGRRYEVHGQLVDNRWIVPYNLYLSVKYDCHINVKCAAHVHSIKYAFKYVHKGGDRATVQFHENEIANYVDGRHVGPLEALWRIYHYPVHKQEPSITHLQIHLPGQHMVLFNPEDSPETIRD